MTALPRAPNPKLHRPVYVTPHAIDRFRERIDSTADDDTVIYWLRHTCNRLPDAVQVRRDMPATGVLLYGFRWRGQLCTAVVATWSSVRMPYPAVVTVLSGRERLHRVRKRRPWGKFRDRQLHALKLWGFDQRQCARILRVSIDDVKRRWW